MYNIVHLLMSGWCREDTRSAVLFTSKLRETEISWTKFWKPSKCDMPWYYNIIQFTFTPTCYARFIKRAKSLNKVTLRGSGIIIALWQGVGEKVATWRRIQNRRSDGLSRKMVTKEQVKWTGNLVNTIPLNGLGQCGVEDR